MLLLLGLELLVLLVVLGDVVIFYGKFPPVASDGRDLGVQQLTRGPPSTDVVREEGFKLSLLAVSPDGNQDTWVD